MTLDESSDMSPPIPSELQRTLLSSGDDTTLADMTSVSHLNDQDDMQADVNDDLSIDKQVANNDDALLCLPRTRTNTNEIENAQIQHIMNDIISMAENGIDIAGKGDSLNLIDLDIIEEDVDDIEASNDIGVDSAGKCSDYNVY